MMLPQELQDMVRAMIADGYRDTEIERSVGVCRTTIAKIRKLVGSPAPDRLFRLFTADRAQMSVAQIANKHGYSRQTVYNVLKGDRNDLSSRGPRDQGGNEGEEQR